MKVRLLNLQVYIHICFKDRVASIMRFLLPLSVRSKVYDPLDHGWIYLLRNLSVLHRRLTRDIEFGRATLRGAKQMR